MALLTISGAPASRWEEVAHGAAQLLGFPLITESRLAQGLAQEFGDVEIPARAWTPAAVCVLAPLAREQHLVIAADGAEELFPNIPGLLRIRVEAPHARRVGNLMLDRRLDKPEATASLRDLDHAQKRLRKTRFGKISPTPSAWDLALNLAHMDVMEAADILAAAAAQHLKRQGLLRADVAGELLFEARLQLARRGIVPITKAADRAPAGASFGHPSEKMFANLLDFYRIEWEYEPRTFSLQWNKEGEVTEAFTPDFYLPQFDLYVELTTMKQSLVTKKNRKVKLLRAIYPHINIQVFYQKDFQDLVSKYGLKMAV
jgi:cytidylate kinase-like protein